MPSGSGSSRGCSPRSRSRWLTSHGCWGDLGAIHRVDVAEWVDRLKPVPTEGGFTFLCPIWKKSGMWCGGDTYVSSLIESVGGVNLMRHHKRYPTIDLDCALALEPQVVFLPDEPYAFTAEDAALFERVVG